MPFKRDSACGWVSGDLYSQRIIDLSTGEPAISVAVRGVTWQESDRVSVDAAYAAATLAAAWYSYDLERKDGRWRVREKKLKAIA